MLQGIINKLFLMYKIKEKICFTHNGQAKHKNKTQTENIVHTKQHRVTGTGTLNMVLTIIVNIVILFPPNTSSP